MKNKEPMRDVLLRVKANLEKIFTEVNSVSETATIAIIQCLKDLEKATDGAIPFTQKEESISRRSQEFADKHKDFCMGVGKQFEGRGLHYFIHIADQLGTNTISFGHMSDEIMAKSLTGTLIQSKMIFQTVMKELGMGPSCIDCMDNVPDGIREGYHPSGDMPEALKHMLEEKLGGMIIPLGSMRIRRHRDDEDESDEKEGGDD